MSDHPMTMAFRAHWRAWGFGLLLGGACLGVAPAQAQSESFLLGPGSNVGPATKIKPTNCVTAPDGSITCDTKIENSPSDTPAKPQGELFSN